MTKRTYTCDACGRTDESEWDEADALAESVRLFGAAIPEDQRSVVCDDCFKAMQAQGIIPPTLH